MMGPSPRGWENKLGEYREHFRSYFDSLRSRQNKETIVIGWYQSGYDAPQIALATGFSLDFVHDVARRFAHRCLVRFINGMYVGEPTRRRK